MITYKEIQENETINTYIKAAEGIVKNNAVLSIEDNNSEASS